MESLQLGFTIGDVFLNKLMQTLSRIVNPMQMWLQFLSYIKLLLCRTYCPSQTLRNCSHCGYVTFTLFVAFIPGRTCNMIWLVLTRRLKHKVLLALLCTSSQPWLQPHQGGCVRIRLAHLDAAIFLCPFNAFSWTSVVISNEIDIFSNLFLTRYFSSIDGWNFVI